jgi:hypothetical protein
MIRETMLDPVKLRGCIGSGGGLDDRSTARELARVAENIILNWMIYPFTCSY